MRERSSAWECRSEGAEVACVCSMRRLERASAATGGRVYATSRRSVLLGTWLWLQARYLCRVRVNVLGATQSECYLSAI